MSQVSPPTPSMPDQPVETPPPPLVQPVEPLDELDQELKTKVGKDLQFARDVLLTAGLDPAAMLEKVSELIHHCHAPAARELVFKSYAMWMSVHSQGVRERIHDKEYRQRVVTECWTHWLRKRMVYFNAFRVIVVHKKYIKHNATPNEAEDEDEELVQGLKKLEATGPAEEKQPHDRLPPETKALFSRVLQDGVNEIGPKFKTCSFKWLPPAVSTKEGHDRTAVYCIVDKLGTPKRVIHKHEFESRQMRDNFLVSLEFLSITTWETLESAKDVMLRRPKREPKVNNKKKKKNTEATETVESSSSSSNSEPSV
jgi:hypothetical protein